EPGTICPAGGQDDDRCAPSPAAPPEHCGELAVDLVEGEREKVRKLDKRNRSAAGQGAPYRCPDDERLAQRRITDAAGKLGRQALRHAKYIAFGILDILTKQGDTRVGTQPMAQHLANGLEHSESGAFGRQVSRSLDADPVRLRR